MPFMGNGAQGNNIKNLYLSTLRKMLKDDEDEKTFQQKKTEEAELFARQGAQNTRYLASQLTSGDLSSYKPGDVKNLDRDILRQSAIDNAAYRQALSDMGLFNQQEYGTNPQTIILPQTDYLKQLQDEFNLGRAASLVQDDFNKAATQRAMEQEAQQKAQLPQLRSAYNDMAARGVLQNGNYTVEDLLYIDSVLSGTPRRSAEEFDALPDDEWASEYERMEKAAAEADWDKLLNPDAAKAPEGYESKTPMYDEYLKMISKELTRRAEVERYEKMAEAMSAYAKQQGYGPTGVYESAYPEADPNTVAGSIELGRRYANDQAYAINNPLSYDDAQKIVGEELWGLEGAYNMTDDEKYKYNTLLRLNPQTANAYYQALLPELTARTAQAEDEYARTRAEDPLLAAFDTGASILMGPVGTAMTGLGALAGIDDPNHWTYGPKRLKDVTIGMAAETYGKLWDTEFLGQPLGSTAYNAVVSLLEMMYAKKLSGGLTQAAGGGTTFAKAAMQTLMSSQTAAGTYMQDLERGFTPEQAAAHGLINGAIEAWSERGFMDNLFSDDGKFMYKVLTGGLAEGLEELESGGLQLVSDAMVSYLTDNVSEVEQVYNYYKQTMGADAAKAQTMTYFAEQLALQGITGWVTGAGTTGSSEAGQYMYNRSLGKSIQKGGDPAAVLDVGLSMDPESASYKLAAEIKAGIDAGKAMSLADLGKLTGQLDEDLTSEQSKVVDGVFDQAIIDRLVELGATEQEARAKAQQVREASRKGKPLTDAQKKRMGWDAAQQQVYRELTMPESVREANRRAESEAFERTPDQSQPMLAPELAQSEAMQGTNETAEQTRERRRRSERYAFDRTLDQNRQELAPELEEELTVEELIERGPAYPPDLGNAARRRAEAQAFDRTLEQNQQELAPEMAQDSATTEDGYRRQRRSERSAFDRTLDQNQQELAPELAQDGATTEDGYRRQRRSERSAFDRTLEQNRQELAPELAHDGATTEDGYRRQRRSERSAYDRTLEQNRQDLAPELAQDTTDSEDGYRQQRRSERSAFDRTLEQNQQELAPELAQDEATPEQPRERRRRTENEAFARTLDQNRQELAPEDEIPTLGQHGKIRSAIEWLDETDAKLLDAQQKISDKRDKLFKAMSRTTAEDVSQAVGNAREKTTRKNRKPENQRSKTMTYETTEGPKTGEFDRFVQEGNQLRAVIKDGTSETTVDLQQIMDEGGIGTATILEYTMESDHQMTAEEGNTLMNAYQETGGDAAIFIEDFEKVYAAGFAGIEAPTTNLPTSVQEKVYQEAVEAGVQAEEDRVNKAKRVRADTEGSVAWLGPVADNSAIRGRGDQNALQEALEGMTESQRTTVDVIQQMAKKLRVNVVLYQSQEGNIGNTANGMYNSDTNVLYVDINSGVYSAKGLRKGRSNNTIGYAMMLTMGHELTHHLEATSPEGYARYRDAVKKQLAANGESWAELVRSKIMTAAAQGRKLTRKGAEAEVIADASEYMLQHSKFVTGLEGGLRSRVKTFVQGFVDKVRSIFNHLVSGHRESAALRKVIDGVNQYTGDLQKLWDAALGETITKPEARHAGAETDEESPKGRRGIAEAKHADAETDEESPKGKKSVSVAKADKVESKAVDQPGKASEMVEDYWEYPQAPVVQFSMDRNVEVRTDGLIAVHNIKEPELESTLKLGGFPMPSIAIVKAKEGHTMYGEYSVIFGKETIDPQASVKNRVYGADAWTPVFPRTETEVLDDVMYDRETEMRDLAAKVDEEYGKKARAWFSRFSGSDATSETMNDLQDSAWNNDGMLAAYMADHGREVQIAEKDVEISRGYNPARADMYNHLLDIVDMADLVDMKGRELIDKYSDQLAAEIPRPFARLNANWKKGDRQAGVRMLEIFKQATAYEGSGRDTSVKTEKVKDYYATGDTMRSSINRDDFREWVKEKLQDAFGMQGIYNGKERFTPSGNRRSFKQLHDPVTAENVVKAMAAQEESNIPATDASGLMAAASSMYKSIAEIKADANRLGKISDEEYNARIAKANNTHHDLLNAIEAWDYDQVEEVGELLVQAAKKRMSASAIATLLKRSGYKATQKDGEIAANLIQQVQTIPSGYFEAKPARVVKFDEIKMVVAPESMPETLATQMESLGIPYTTYDGTDKDRLEKMNAVGNAQFSTRDLPDGVTVREYLGALKPTSRMTDTERELLGRYQAKLKVLQETEELASQENEILKKAHGDDLLKSKSRYMTYRNKANRISRELSRIERAEGFAGLMATSRTLLDEYLLGTAGDMADAQDRLDEEVQNLTNRLQVIGNTLEGAAKGQRDAFARGLFDQKQLDEAAKQLKDSYNSRMSVKQIANRLALAYGELYANEGAEGAKKFTEAAKELAQDILNSSKYRYHSEVLTAIAEELPTISLTETDKQEIRNAGLSLTDYKRGLSPYVRVVEGASDLSSYVTNAEAYGGKIARILGDDTEGNLAMALYNVIQAERADEAAATFEGMSESASLSVVMADVVSLNLPKTANDGTLEYLRKELQKYAGENEQASRSVDEAIKAAKRTTARASDVWREAVKTKETANKVVEYYRALEEQRRLLELQEQKKTLTEQLKGDAAQKLHDRIKEQRQEYREREQKARTYRATRADLEKLRRSIGRKVKRLNALRMRETDQKHVPQELQHVADVIMQTFTESNLARLAFAPQQTASLARRYRALQTLERDMTYFWDDEIAEDIENLQALGEAYTGLTTNPDGSVARVFTLEGVALETEILQGVDNIVSNVMRMIDSENDQFIRERTETFEQFAEKTGDDLLKLDDAKVRKGKLGDLQMAMDEMFRTGNMTPVYFFESLKNQRFTDVFNGIRKGQTEAARIIRESQAFVQETMAKYHYGRWAGDGKITFQTSQGHQITLSREQAMWAYATAKREKSNPLYKTEHLLVGGFQYKDTANTGEGKNRETGLPHQLDDADIARIGQWLTDEQKAYADEIVGYLSSNMAEYGNEASMRMYGYRKFNESYYFPFQTSAEQRIQRGDEGAGGENAGTGRVKNAGFTKKLQHGANATLLMDDFTKVAVEHMQKMANYSAMVEPIEDLKRLLNHRILMADGTIQTIRALMGQKYGKPAQNYMQELLKDLNGAAQGDRRATKGVDYMVNAFKRGAVMGSLSVVLQQPTALARAMSMVDPKHFTNNPFYRPSKGVWDEMLKYSGTAIIKDMGKFDMGMGKSASEYIMDEHLTPKQAYERFRSEGKAKGFAAGFSSFMSWLTSAPGKADQWTWGLLWQAVKNETASKHPGMNTSGEEFLELVGERFDDVVDHTQVYDSVLTRSNLMRSTNAIHKMATSFMAEPTLAINMLYNAFTGGHGKAKAGAIIGGVMASQILAGLMAALVQAWNDDKDKRNWAEKYADKASSNILDNINPLGMVPYISDIMSLMQGYEVERADMTVFATLIKYTGQFWDKLTKGEALTMKDWENFAGNWANLTGVPAKNILREIRRTKNVLLNTDWGAPNMANLGYTLMENTPFYSGNNSVYYERLAAALLKGDEEEAENLRGYMLTSKMASADAIDNGVKKAVKDMYADGKVDTKAATDFLVKNELAKDATEAYWEVDKWEWMRETGGAAGDYRKYEDFYKAVETGKDLKKVLKTYTDNGVTAKTLAANLTEQYKPKLKELYKTNKAEFSNLQARLLTAYQALGYDRDKKLKDIQKWLDEE